jgi:hypothetical protein
MRCGVSPRDPAKPSVWLQLALCFTTRPLRKRPWGLDDMTDRKLRSAEPGWDRIWSHHREAQARLAVIVMPQPRLGDRKAAGQALLTHRASSFGLTAAAPPADLLARAEAERFRRLAPHWVDNIGKYQR